MPRAGAFPVPDVVAIAAGFTIQALPCRARPGGMVVEDGKEGAGQASSARGRALFFPGFQVFRLSGGCTLVAAPVVATLGFQQREPQQQGLQLGR